MKNKNFKFGFLLVCLIGVGACNDEFLEEIPQAELSPELFFQSRADLANYNNTLYHMAADDDQHAIMRGLNYGGLAYNGGVWWDEEFSDNLAPTTGRTNEFTNVRLGIHTVQNDSRIQGYRGWELIQHLNYGLENYDRANESDSIINMYRGEALLFRAWFYADKISKFGEAQWFGESLNIDSEQLFSPKDSRDFVMDKVLEDLNLAIQYLPEEWETGKTYGRLTKWAALAVKSRIALFEGTWRKYHGLGDEVKWLNASLDASTRIMNEGPFSLYSTGNPTLDYQKIVSTESHETDPETIYWRKYEPGMAGHFSSRLFFNYNGGATKDFVDDFLAIDGLPITLSPLYMGDDSIESTFVNRDPRLRQSVLHPDDQALLNYANDPVNSYPRINGMSGGRNKSNTGYHVVKHWNAVDEQRNREQQIASPAEFRLGEILLNYAEAKAELGTISQADLDRSINLLRARVGFDPDAYLTTDPPLDPKYANAPNLDGANKALIIEIRRERRIELFLEGHRYHDMRRWKWGALFAGRDLGIRWDAAAIARFSGANVKTYDVDGVPYIHVRGETGQEVAIFDESKHYLWPIPVNSISDNPNLTQTPGW